MNPNPNSSESLKPQDHATHSVDYAPYPKLDPIDLTDPPSQPVTTETWTSVPVESDHPKTSTTATTVTPTPTATAATTTSESLPKQQQEQQATASFNTPRSPTAAEGPAAPISANSDTTMPAESNPYVSTGPAHGPGASVKSNCSPA